MAAVTTRQKNHGGRRVDTEKRSGRRVQIGDGASHVNVNSFPPHHGTLALRMRPRVFSLPAPCSSLAPRASFISPIAIGPAERHDRRQSAPIQSPVFCASVMSP